MAKIQFGMMMTDASGKLGGHVFSKNRGGAYVRTKVIPLNPDTTYQQNARYLLSNFSKAWSGLTLAQIAAWNAAVSAFAKNDRLGNLRNPTGKNLYVKLNVNLANVGGSAITDPPVPPALSEITGLAVTSTAPGTVAIAWTSGAVPTAENWIVEATKNTNAGKLFVKSLFRIIGVIAPAATSPSAQGTNYVAKFGNLTSGQRITIRITQIDNTTGVAGIPVTATVIVA
jgi:hypothetical protein